MSQSDLYVVCKAPATVPLMFEMRGVGGTYLTVGKKYKVSKTGSFGNYKTYYIDDQEYFSWHFCTLSKWRNKKLKKILSK